MFLVFFKKWVVGLTVFLLSALLYLPALQNDFVNWDDDLYVYENPAIRNLDLKTVAWMFTSYRTANWHPLTWLSHSVDYALWGLNPFGHHLTSIILHGLNSLLVFLVVLQLLQWVRESPGGAGSGQAREVSAAGIAALLFGFHPLHVESVAWISERKDLLCAFFVLLSIWAYFAAMRLHRLADESGSGSLPALFSLLLRSWQNPWPSAFPSSCY